eukprot:gene7999-12464_t
MSTEERYTNHKSIDNVGKEVYNEFIQQKELKNPQLYEVLFKYFLMNLHCVNDYQRKKNMEKCQKIFEKTPNEILPSLFQDFDYFFQMCLNNSNYKELIFFVLEKYYSYSIQKYKIIPNLLLNSQFVIDYEFIKLILENEKEEHLNKKTFISTFISKYYNQKNAFKIILLFLKSGFKLPLSKDLSTKFTIEELRELYFTYLTYNENCDLNTMNIILKFFVEQDFLDDIKKIMKKREIKLNEILFKNEEENLLFCCKSMNTFKYLIKNDVSMKKINKNNQTVLHSLFRCKGLIKTDIDEILKSFPNELLNKFDIFNKTETNILISNSQFDLAKYLIENYNLIYSDPEIFNLPDELIEYILSILNPNDNFNISLTCKMLNKISNSNIVWQYMCISNFEYRENLFRTDYKNLYHSFLNSNSLLNQSSGSFFNYGPYFQKSFCNKEWRDFSIDEIIDRLIFKEFKQKSINMNHKFIKENPNLEFHLENEYYNELLSSIKNFKKNKLSPFKRIEKYWRDEIKIRKFKEVKEKEYIMKFPKEKS